MRKSFIGILLIFVTGRCLCQPYISLAPSLTNTPGTISDKSNIALELGEQWDVFSLGLDLGKTTLSPVGTSDTSNYLEIRPSLNVFQQGNFTNTLTIGIGYIFGAKENLLTELTYGIEYAFTPKIHFNVFFGQYFYSGKVSASNATFLGVSAMFYFSPNGGGSLIKPKAKSK